MKTDLKQKYVPEFSIKCIEIDYTVLGHSSLLKSGRFPTWIKL